LFSTPTNRRFSRLVAVLAPALLLGLPVAVLAQQVAPAAIAAIATPIFSIPPVAGPAHDLPSAPPLIVVGFAGGFIKRTSAVHGEISLALRLRQRFGAAIHSEIFENHHGDDAHREILRLIDASAPAVPGGNRRLIAHRRSARVILYGHSWGASEADDVARLLQQDGVPILLLVQVDGVYKGQRDDSIIPANVAQAINFYQTDGFLHGRARITAADPAATRILGNVHLSYKHNNVPTPGYPWFARHFTRRHIEIENDPRVWNRVEAMVAKAIVGQGAGQNMTASNLAISTGPTK
jgi:hypothetical protein